MARSKIHPPGDAAAPRVERERRAPCVGTRDRLLAPRVENPDEYVSLGFDGRGRLLEVVGVSGDGGSWLLYHAMTPPSDKTYREFGLGR